MVTCGNIGHCKIATMSWLFKYVLFSQNSYCLWAFMKSTFSKDHRIRISKMRENHNSKDKSMSGCCQQRFPELIT